MSGKCQINGRMSYTVTDPSSCDDPSSWVAHDDATPQGPGQTVT